MFSLLANTPLSNCYAFYQMFNSQRQAHHLNATFSNGSEIDLALKFQFWNDPLSGCHIQSRVPLTCISRSK